MAVLQLMRLSIVLIHCEIFFHRFVHLETHVDFYKKHHLIQAGESTFGCVGRPIVFRWRYVYPDHVNTVWAKQVNEKRINLGSCSSNTFALDEEADTLGFSSPARLSSKNCASLVINSGEKRDEGLYFINIITSDPDEREKSGKTTLYIYEDCPNVFYPQLSISCEVNASSSSSSSVKRTDFTYRDIVNLSMTFPGDANVVRRFFYQEQQHKIVQQPIRAKCYTCAEIRWTMSKQSLSLAFFSKNPYLNMTLYARIYHKKALLSQLSTTFRVVDPESEKGKMIPKCKDQEQFATGGRESLTWNVALLTSMTTLAVSNFAHQNILLS